MLKTAFRHLLDLLRNKLKIRHQQPAHNERVLVLGIYLANKENTVQHLVKALSKSRQYHVDQRWVALNGKPPSTKVSAVTHLQVTGVVPKFELINRLLSHVNLNDYSFVLVCDDDITVPDGFIDLFLEQQTRYNFALAQPARTHNSYLDHAIVEVVDDLAARQTRFVEIGPIFSIRHDAFSVLLPFDEQAPMGWGLDFVWPVILESAGLKMGIIDAVLADHSLRKPFTQYDGDKALNEMQLFLKDRPHLEPHEAFVVLNEFRDTKIG